MKKRSDEYYAGLFDGEGTVGVYAAGASVNGWSARLCIVGTHRPMIVSCYEHFGVGSFASAKRQAIGTLPSGGNPRLGKQGWRWMVTRRREVNMILTRIAPYLIEKKEQSEIVLRFISGELNGSEASQMCKVAKRFSFDASLGEPPKRATGSKAEDNPNARLTFAKANEIREMINNGTKQVEVCKLLGLSKTMVSRIALGRTYTHAPTTRT
jgi:hypothetical protein